LKKKVNIPELPQNLVILPYTEEIRKATLKQVAKELANCILPGKLASTISDSINIIYKNRPSIANVLVNNRSYNLDPDNPPRCLGPPYCNEGSHYSKQLHHKEGVTKLLK